MTEKGDEIGGGGGGRKERERERERAEFWDTVSWGEKEDLGK